MAGLAAAAVLASQVAGAGGAAAAGRHRGGGPVDVLYAGSLVDLMEHAVGPAFDGATGYTFSGYAGGSDALAAEIRGRTQLADVFVSASPKVNATLEGPTNGHWVSWYAAFATSPLVLGYNPRSAFAARLRSRPWYEVVTAPGFLLGRTDPATDPKGALAVEALEGAAAAHRLPALRTAAAGTAGVFPEETLVGRLQSGQLDAGFFYAAEAAAAGIPTVPLTGVRLGATYTVTALDRAPHAKAARAFLAYLLGRQGRTVLLRHGLSPVAPPAVAGARHVPKDLRATLHVR